MIHGEAIPHEEKVFSLFQPLTEWISKGKLSQEHRAIEQSAAFKQARRSHAAVESALNALEVHGLDQCPGLAGFKRYVALAVVARNIQRIGDIVRQQDQACEKRRQAAERGWQDKQAA